MAGRKNNRIYSHEKGIAMITVMLMLTILTVLGITMAGNSIVGSYISSNQRVSKEAFYDADAGVEYALARIQKDLNDMTISIDNLNNPHGLDLDYLDLPNLRPDGFNFSYPGPLLKHGNSYCFTSRGKDPGSAGARAEIMACFHVESVTHPVFGMGIVSNGDIDISWLAQIDGDLHSNGSIFQSGGWQPAEITGNITACGTIDPAIAKDSSGGDEPVDMPALTAHDLTAWKMMADDVFENPEQGTVEFKQDDELSNMVVFVDGDVVLDRAKLAGTTIISTGNVYFQGSSESNSQGTANAVIAGGDIHYNGHEATDVVFWCSGRFHHNGGAAIHGSIVSGEGVEDLSSGSDELEESLDFQVSENITNPFIPTQFKVQPDFWADNSLL